MRFKCSVYFIHLFFLWLKIPKQLKWLLNGLDQSLGIKGLLCLDINNKKTKTTKKPCNPLTAVIWRINLRIRLCGWFKKKCDINIYHLQRKWNLESVTFRVQQRAAHSLSEPYFERNSLSWHTVFSLNQLKSCLNCNVRVFTYDFKVTCEDFFSVGATCHFPSLRKIPLS